VVVEFDIWVGAGQCDTSKGFKAGTGTLTVDTSKHAIFKYSVTNSEVRSVGTVKAYIGTSSITTNAPGQMPITVVLNPSTKSYTVPSFTVPDNFYFYIHFDFQVCGC